MEQVYDPRNNTKDTRTHTKSGLVSWSLRVPPFRVISWIVRYST